MLAFRFRRASRLLCILFGLTGLALPAMAGPGTVRPDAFASVLSSQPFGGATWQITDGALLEKWRTVEREIDNEMVVIALCQENRSSCTSAAALQFLAIVDKASVLQGRARIGEINRAINLSIRPVSDLALYGVDDVWSSPLATFTAGAGDCEDYAIAKLVALRAAGVELDDLRLTIFHDARRAQDHAIVAVRLDGHWLMLDNQRLMMLEDTELRDARPIVSIDGGGMRMYAPS
jgi:predicted transglutaminase-like cysteine proteinase